VNNIHNLIQSRTESSSFTSSLEESNFNSKVTNLVLQLSSESSLKIEDIPALINISSM